MVASALTASGYTTGLNTSPHLHTLNERIRVDGELIFDEELVDLVERLQPEVEAVNQRATYGQLTTFELLTVLAFTHFERKGADFQVLEAGMGGRLDATNVITPEVSIITSISFDHMQALGHTLSEIASEKAGIIKPGCPVVTSPQPDEAARVIENTCQRHGVELIRVGRDVTWQSLGFNFDRQQLRVEGRLGGYELAIPLLGHYQLVNAATAVAALEVLAEKGFNISKDSITRGLARVSWPGRFQILSHHPVIVVDGAHNPAGAGRLRESLEQYFHPDRAILVIGTSSDKDISGIADELATLFKRVIVTCARHPRAMAPAVVVAAFDRYGLEAEVIDDVATALSRAVALAGDRDLICVTGSLFVVAEAIERVSSAGLQG